MKMPRITGWTFRWGRFAYCSFVFAMAVGLCGWRGALIAAVACVDLELPQ